jgi:hypothetical protein
MGGATSLTGNFVGALRYFQLRSPASYSLIDLIFVSGILFIKGGRHTLQ